APVSQITVPQFFLTGCCQGRRAGKSIVNSSPAALPSFSISFTNVRDTSADPGNVVLLGNEKRYDHLPQILSQDPDSLSEIGRFCKISILLVNLSYKTSVICFQIKIGLPEVFHLLRGTIKFTHRSLLPDFQIFICSHYGKPSFSHLFHAEARSRPIDLPYVIILQLFFYPLFHSPLPYPCIFPYSSFISGERNKIIGQQSHGNSIPYICNAESGGHGHRHGHTD